MVSYYAYLGLYLSMFMTVFLNFNITPIIIDNFISYTAFISAISMIFLIKANYKENVLLGRNKYSRILILLYFLLFFPSLILLLTMAKNNLVINSFHSFSLFSFICLIILFSIFLLYSANHPKVKVLEIVKNSLIFNSWGLILAVLIIFNFLFISEPLNKSFENATALSFIIILTLLIKVCIITRAYNIVQTYPD